MCDIVADLLFIFALIMFFFGFVMQNLVSYLVLQSSGFEESTVCFTLSSSSHVTCVGLQCTIVAFSGHTYFKLMTLGIYFTVMQLLEDMLSILEDIVLIKVCHYIDDDELAA